MRRGRSSSMSRAMASISARCGRYGQSRPAHYSRHRAGARHGAGESPSPGAGRLLHRGPTWMQTITKSACRAGRSGRCWRQWSYRHPTRQFMHSASMHGLQRGGVEIAQAQRGPASRGSRMSVASVPCRRWRSPADDDGCAAHCGQSLRLLGWKSLDFAPAMRGGVRPPSMTSVWVIMSNSGAGRQTTSPTSARHQLAHGHWRPRRATKSGAISSLSAQIRSGRDGQHHGVDGASSRASASVSR